MVVIRLARGGRNKAPYYSIVVTPSRSPRNGRFIEKIGHYCPIGTDRGCVLDKERYDHWISQGAQPSDRVKSLYRNTHHATHDSAEAA